MQGLIRGRRVGQGLICGVEILLELFILLLQCRQLHARVFILPECRNGLADFFRINLGRQVDPHDDCLTVERRIDLLVEHENQTGGVGTDFVFGDVHPLDYGDTLQVCGDLFECVPLGRFRGKPDRVFARVAVSHPVLPLGVDDPDLGKCRGCGQESSGKQKEAEEEMNLWKGLGVRGRWLVI